MAGTGGSTAGEGGNAAGAKAFDGEPPLNEADVSGHDTDGWPDTSTVAVATSRMPQRFIRRGHSGVADRSTAPKDRFLHFAAQSVPFGVPNDCATKFLRCVIGA